MSHNDSSFLTRGEPRKRKEREDSNTTTSLGGSESALENNNQLLAGYMAYEFLTKGTLFGQKFDPARAKAVPVQSAAESRKLERSRKNKLEAEPNNGNANKLPSQTYAEVASLLKSNGTHIPGFERARLSFNIQR
ncbi:hypothetical protein ACH5RR_032985 [Cinchona calisaya]|uniref:Uncharacterized protein n=1 Tax=Cinchona calisaya TaxID=153742 RepID=A0ABD2YPY9_9GENT